MNTDEYIIELLEQQKNDDTLKPSEAVLRSALSRLDADPNVRSNTTPYLEPRIKPAAVKSPVAYFTYLASPFALGLVALVLIVAGGFTYFRISRSGVSGNSPSSSSAVANNVVVGDISDTGIQNDLNTIDTEMKGLQTDTAHVDKAFQTDVSDAATLPA